MMESSKSASKVGFNSLEVRENLVLNSFQNKKKDSPWIAPSNCGTDLTLAHPHLTS